MYYKQIFKKYRSPIQLTFFELIKEIQRTQTKASAIGLRPLKSLLATQKKWKIENCNYCTNIDLKHDKKTARKLIAVKIDHCTKT